MRLNTMESLQLARRVKDMYGTWAKVREASRLEGNIYVLRNPPAADEDDDADAA